MGALRVAVKDPLLLFLTASLARVRLQIVLGAPQLSDLTAIAGI